MKKKSFREGKMKDCDPKDACKEKRASHRVPNQYGIPRQNYSATYHYNQISFWLNGVETAADIPPAMTTLDFLHQELGMFGTKCSCNEGDCGACTVVIAYPAGSSIRYEAINSCLYPAAKLHGKHLITIESLGTPDRLHPIQQVMLDFHSTQCGYCTPGFVMSLFALLVSQQNPDRERILAALEGNLCRCTGYDSILKAAEYLAAQYDIGGILPPWCRTIEPKLMQFNKLRGNLEKSCNRLYPCHQYYSPHTLEELFGLFELLEGREFRLINGGTDIMVQINIMRIPYPILIDISAIGILKNLQITDDKISIGANITYSELLNSPLIRQHLAPLRYIIKRIASEQIRNFGTLAGNIGNASPIGDGIPLLLALDSSLELLGAAGTRSIALSDFFLDYRKTALQKHEIIANIQIPIPSPHAIVRCLKASKRKSVDISAMSSAMFLQLEGNIVCRANLAMGGVAKIPIRSQSFTHELLDKDFRKIDAQHIAQLVSKEFEPISDVRGSGSYRRKLIQNHVLKYLAEAKDGSGRSS